MNILPTLRRIQNDIKHLKHIDVYIVSFTAVILALVGLIPDLVSDDVRTSVILASLGVLVFNISVPQKTISSHDDILNDRNSFVTMQDRIKGKKVFWMYGPSAVNALSPQNINAIRDEILNHPDGEFRVILQNPNEIEAVNILVKQVDEGLNYALQDLPTSIGETMNRLEKLDSWTRKGKFEYRFLDYGPGFSMLAVNPNKKDGHIMVEFYGFHNTTTENRMNIQLTMADSEHWYSYWINQYEEMWKKSKRLDEI